MKSTVPLIVTLFVIIISHTESSYKQNIVGEKIITWSRNLIRTNPVNLLQSTSIFSRISVPIRYLPPIIIFLFVASSKVLASPMNPQIIALKGPFFQGWLVRIIDHSRRLSIMFIVGSFSESESNKYNEHYVFCCVNYDGISFFREVFPQPEHVKITGSLPSTPSIFKSSIVGANITWDAEGLGYFKFDGNNTFINFKFPDINLNIEIKNRFQWNIGDTLDGPEGWLRYTLFLPCHYFVHSIGSDATYNINLPNLGNLVGNGYAHIEGNHGQFFPTGWIWAQAIAPNNIASFSITGGRFTIAGFTPMTWIIFIRIRNKHLIFRTTDFAKVTHKIELHTGNILIEAISPLGNNKVILSIISNTSIDNFSPPLHTPTPYGFSNTPGCREVYSAIAKVSLFSFDELYDSYILSDEIEFPLTVLEFGGSFLTTIG